MLSELNKMFDEIFQFAERNQQCLRKAVGCAAVTFDANLDCIPHHIAMTHNGPSREGNKCLNIVGGCGCSHAEPRLVQSVLQLSGIVKMPLILMCSYSPCTNCANIIIDSKLFRGCIYDVLTLHDIRGAEFLESVMPVLTRQEIKEAIETENYDKIKKWISNTIS
jgi:deoxycytidylate deaminase